MRSILLLTQKDFQKFFVSFPAKKNSTGLVARNGDTPLHSLMKYNLDDLLLIK